MSSSSNVTLYSTTQKGRCVNEVYHRLHYCTNTLSPSATLRTDIPVSAQMVAISPKVRRRHRKMTEVSGSKDNTRSTLPIATFLDLEIEAITKQLRKDVS